MKQRTLWLMVIALTAVQAQATQRDALNALDAIEGRLSIMATAISAQDYKTVYDVTVEMGRDYFSVSSFLSEASREQSGLPAFRRADARCRILDSHIDFLQRFSYLSRYTVTEFVLPAELTYFARPVSKEVRKCRRGVQGVQ